MSSLSDYRPLAPSQVKWYYSSAPYKRHGVADIPAKRGEWFRFCPSDSRKLERCDLYSAIHDYVRHESSHNEQLPSYGCENVIIMPYEGICVAHSPPPRALHTHPPSTPDPSRPPPSRTHTPHLLLFLSTSSPSLFREHRDGIESFWWQEVAAAYHKKQPTVSSELETTPDPQTFDTDSEDDDTLHETFSQPSTSGRTSGGAPQRRGCPSPRNSSSLPTYPARTSTFPYPPTWPAPLGSPALDGPRRALVRARAHEADLLLRRAIASYVATPPVRLRRGTWFVEKTNNSDEWLPVSESLADQVEEAYRSLVVDEQRSSSSRGGEGEGIIGDNNKGARSGQRPTTPATAPAGPGSTSITSTATPVNPEGTYVPHEAHEGGEGERGAGSRGKGETREWGECEDGKKKGRGSRENPHDDITTSLEGIDAGLPFVNRPGRTGNLAPASPNPNPNPNPTPARVVYLTSGMGPRGSTHKLIMYSTRELMLATDDVSSRVSRAIGIGGPRVPGYVSLQPLPSTSLSFLPSFLPSFNFLHVTHPRHTNQHKK